jgi:hypothetical protein
VLRYYRESSADPAAAWALLARPDRWSEWAPHIRGAWGLGSPEVQPGRRGLVRVLGVVPVPVTVIAKRPGRSWTWQVGPARLKHAVEPLSSDRGCVISITIEAPRSVEATFALTYGPLVGLLVRNLARVAPDR